VSGANIFHLHIPKTAGTSLRTAFVCNKYKVAPIGSEFAFDPQQHADVDLFSGHAGYRAVANSPALRGRVVTILRDPYDRALSYYYHLIKLHREGLENSERTNLATKYSLFDFLAIRDHPHILSDLYNAVTWQLVHDPDINARMGYRLDQPRLTDSDLVERAKANLSSFLVVGFQTRMDAFAEDLRRATGFDHKLGVDNANTSRAAPEAIDVETRRRLGAWIEMDVEVYNWALTHFRRD
jgi:hypothetical protein